LVPYENAPGVTIPFFLSRLLCSLIGYCPANGVLSSGTGTSRFQAALGFESASLTLPLLATSRRVQTGGPQRQFIMFSRVASLYDRWRLFSPLPPEEAAYSFGVNSRGGHAVGLGDSSLEYSSSTSFSPRFIGFFLGILLVVLCLFLIGIGTSPLFGEEVLGRQNSSGYALFFDLQAPLDLTFNVYYSWDEPPPSRK